MKQFDVAESTLSIDILCEEFWRNEFVRDTKDGTSPFLFKKVFPSDLTRLQSVTNAFQSFQDTKIREKVVSHARIYLHEERRDDLMIKVVNETFLPEETLCEFIQRLTNAERFSLIINNFEQICPLLAADIGQFIQCMFSVRGAPIGGCEQVAFIGNYSGTAFGVHEGYEHAFLVHLGPGIKEFYCWSQKKYLELTHGERTPTYGDYTWMLQYAEKFILEPGDILYLPALVFHVGRQSHFSISVAVPFYTYPKERFFTKIIVPGLSTLLPFDLEGMSKPIPLKNGSENFINEFLPLAKTIFSDYLRKELDLILSYRWHRLASNSFWEIADNYVNDPLEEVELSKNAMTLYKNCKLQLISPYKICWEKSLNCSGDELRVFIRACSVVVPYKQELIFLFKKLNNNAVIPLLEDWQIPIFSMLSQTGGLQKK
jgi:hypothetical protein